MSKSISYKKDRSPIDPNCSCKVCRNYSRSYIYHLLKTEELIGFNLLSYHNVFFMLQLMKQIREAINEGTFQVLKKMWMG